VNLDVDKQSIISLLFGQYAKGRSENR